MGKKERYIIDDENENTLTMGINSAKMVLEKAGLSGEDIDMIVFSTQVLERTLPTNATYVHNAIDARKDTMVFDTNANCAEMTTSVEIVSRYMMASPWVNRALVIGSDANSLISNPDQEITYANFSDASASIILEKTEENTGFFDAIYDVDSSNKENISFPQDGFSKTIGKVEHIVFLPFDGSAPVPDACVMIDKLLERNKLSIEDIDSFCFFQFALTNILKIQKHFSIQDEKIVYVGDKYGYTTTSSPFVSLYEGVKTEKIKRGDKYYFGLSERVMKWVLCYLNIRGLRTAWWWSPQNAIVLLCR
ncbi:3-oxoacyl-[acyl-carrier-protein] synthase III C-terminal domain-containing protein [Oceanobacillus sp. 1P07AA]|uniref:3-oxoacyl-[acyl-carrier-protein] synthase III C-terminal domain-containing protein n=1 Tax=Oceanobacillus sp. 1P07AA TaxID=3132293 RepID=UPI0039A53449